MIQNPFQYHSAIIGGAILGRRKSSVNRLIERLATRERRHQPMALATDQGDTLAKGYLARSEGHLALQLTN